jgi:calcineurin-like phosphoesterase family protein
MAIFFTGDTHFSHAAIIDFAKRPFSTVAEMDEALVCNWNAVVGRTDTVYHLGDFGLTSAQALGRLRGRLRGSVCLVRGNHDDGAPTKLFEWVKDLYGLRVIVGGIDRQIVLCHYPMLSWNGSHYGTWHLHGHCHGSLPSQRGALRLDVGVDCWSFAPVSLQQIAERMERLRR